MESNPRPENEILLAGKNGFKVDDVKVFFPR
jgi:hypothetical protein